MQEIDIRHSRPDDIAFIERLYPAAFPDEDLLPLVRQLLADETGGLSLVAVLNHVVAGHIFFSICGVEGTAAKAALLGPLAVAPERQRQGIGTALIREGLKQLKPTGVARIFVLGDPAYYRRSGFATETGVAPPYPLPEQYRDAWQSLSLDAGADPAGGKLVVPEVWRQPALWGP